MKMYKILLTELKKGKWFYRNVHGEPIDFTYYEKASISTDIFQFYRYINFLSNKTSFAIENHAYEIIATCQCQYRDGLSTFSLKIKIMIW